MVGGFGDLAHLADALVCVAAVEGLAGADHVYDGGDREDVDQEAEDPKAALDSEHPEFGTPGNELPLSAVFARVLISDVDQHEDPRHRTTHKTSPQSHVNPES